LILKSGLHEPSQHAFYLKEPGANRGLTDPNQHAPVRLGCFDSPGVLHWEVPNIVGEQGTTLTSGIHHLFIV